MWCDVERRLENFKELNYISINCVIVQSKERKKNKQNVSG